MEIQQRTFGGLRSKIAAAMFAAVFLLAQIVVSALAAHTASALTTVPVTSLTSSGWSIADTRTNGHVALINDVTAPLGAGALSLKTDANPTSSQDKAQFMTVANIPLATAVNNPIYYSTKQNSASFVAGLPSYQVAVNLLGTSGFTTLVYEPYNNHGNAAVHNGEWQQWNVGEGKFWSTRAVGSLQPSQGQYQYTLAQILNEFPNAVVLNIGVNVGSNNPAYDTEVDGLAFNDKLYDFERLPDAPTGLGFAQTGLVCGGATNNNSVTINWSAVENASGYTYRVDKPDGTSIESMTTSTTATYTFGAEGQYSFKVRANGAGGTQSDWSTICAITYDKTAPTVGFTTNPWSGSVGSSVTFVGTSSGATSVKVYLGTTELGTATPTANGTWSLTVTIPAVSSGIYALKAVAYDAAGNTATTYPWYSFMVVSFPSWWY